VVALVSLLLLAGPVTPPASADSCDGVWVVVDARDAGGTITTRCAPGDPSTGLDALALAGHQVTDVPRIRGMVCTIDARPDPCNGAPADAYWSYWYTEAGGSWIYATAGAGTRDPAPGSVEGWRFGDGTAPPGITPPASAAPVPPPEPTPTPTPPEPDPPSPDPAPAAPDDGDRGGTAAPGQDPGVSRTGPPAAATGTGDGAVPTEPAAVDPDIDGSETESAGRREHLLDPRLSPSLPMARPAASVADAAATGGTAGAEEPAEDDPVPSRGVVDDRTEVDGARLAASTSAEPTGPVPVAPVVAVGLLVGVGLLTWWHRRRVGGAGS
jgi:hypothetical protein